MGPTIIEFLESAKKDYLRSDLRRRYRRYFTFYENLLRHGCWRLLVQAPAQKNRLHHERQPRTNIIMEM